MRLEGTCRELRVSTAEGHLLTYLAAYAPCSIGEVRRVFGLKGSTLTSMLDRLEESGLLRREPNPADRRSLLLAIEPPGERIASALREEIETFEADLKRRISDRDLAGFSAVMKAVGELTGVQLREETEP